MIRSILKNNEPPIPQCWPISFASLRWRMKELNDFFLSCRFLFSSSSPSLICTNSGNIQHLSTLLLWPLPPTPHSQFKGLLPFFIKSTLNLALFFLFLHPTFHLLNGPSSCLQLILPAAPLILFGLPSNLPWFFPVSKKPSLDQSSASNCCTPLSVVHLLERAAIPPILASPLLSFWPSTVCSCSIRFTKITRTPKHCRVQGVLLHHTAQPLCSLLIILSCSGIDLILAVNWVDGTFFPLILASAQLPKLSVPLLKLRF